MYMCLVKNFNWLYEVTIATHVSNRDICRYTKKVICMHLYKVNILWRRQSLDKGKHIIHIQVFHNWVSDIIDSILVICLDESETHHLCLGLAIFFTKNNKFTRGTQPFRLGLVRLLSYKDLYSVINVGNITIINWHIQTNLKILSSYLLTLPHLGSASRKECASRAGD